MREIIMIETNQSQQVKKMLEKAHIVYKIFQEPKKSVNIFANYGEIIKDKEREKELKL
jgi:ABC-type dipeptide/oligopeptide/nickel transport system ATPase subunit